MQAASGPKNHPLGWEWRTLGKKGVTKEPGPSPKAQTTDPGPGLGESPWVAGCLRGEL